MDEKVVRSQIKKRMEQMMADWTATGGSLDDLVAAAKEGDPAIARLAAGYELDQADLQELVDMSQVSERGGRTGSNWTAMVRDWTMTGKRLGQLIEAIRKENPLIWELADRYGLSCQDLHELLVLSDLADELLQGKKPLWPRAETNRAWVWRTMRQLAAMERSRAARGAAGAEGQQPAVTGASPEDPLDKVPSEARKALRDWISSGGTVEEFLALSADELRQLGVSDVAIAAMGRFRYQSTKPEDQSALARWLKIGGTAEDFEKLGTEERAGLRVAMGARGGGR